MRRGTPPAGAGGGTNAWLGPRGRRPGQVQRQPHRAAGRRARRRLPGGIPAPLTATSYGAGELIVAAAAAGARRIVLGLGGVACTDGGAGMVAALGGRLLDRAGKPLPPGGAALRTLD